MRPKKDQETYLRFLILILIILSITAIMLSIVIVSSFYTKETKQGYEDAKGNIIGISDKNFSLLVEEQPEEMEEEFESGAWKRVIFSADMDNIEYTLSYRNEYMEEKEDHVWVNTKNNTITQLYYETPFLLVSIYDYIAEDEEGLENKGDLQATYVVYPDGEYEIVD